jgi:hypothetical protein
MCALLHLAKIFDIIPSDSPNKPTNTQLVGSFDNNGIPTLHVIVKYFYTQYIATKTFNVNFSEESESSEVELVVTYLKDEYDQLNAVGTPVCGSCSIQKRVIRYRLS